jgi:hypothetical protein
MRRCDPAAPAATSQYTCVSVKSFAWKTFGVIDWKS